MHRDMSDEYFIIFPSSEVLLEYCEQVFFNIKQIRDVGATVDLFFSREVLKHSKRIAVAENMNRLCRYEFRHVHVCGSDDHEYAKIILKYIPLDTCLINESVHGSPLDTRILQTVQARHLTAQGTS